jgi:hypothetical protein
LRPPELSYAHSRAYLEQSRLVHLCRASRLPSCLLSGKTAAPFAGRRGS